MLWRQLLVAVFSIVLLAGCGIQSVEEYERLEEAERSVEVHPEVIEEPVTEQIEEKSAPPKEVIDEEPKLEAIKQEEPKTEVQPAPKVEVKAEQPVAVKQAQKVEAPAPEPTPQVKEEPVKQEPVKEEPVPVPVPQKRTVKIAIYVHNLVVNMDKLHPSLKSEKYVPASGVVLAPVTYELLSDKDTVWDVLRRAAKEHSIQLEYEGADENIYDSVYIEGIHHLYEFSAGPLSGWMYSVNGDFPNVGASQKKLADGDVIEWHYTLDLGRDLGEDV